SHLCLCRISCAASLQHLHLSSVPEKFHSELTSSRTPRHLKDQRLMLSPSFNPLAFTTSFHPQTKA
ncbi:unnamed protein product, partial [Brassica oleracea var. botrytis]